MAIGVSLGRVLLCLIHGASACTTSVMLFNCRTLERESEMETTSEWSTPNWVKDEETKKKDEKKDEDTKKKDEDEDEDPQEEVLGAEEEAWLQEKKKHT